MIKYRTAYGYPYPTIRAAEVERETEHTVWILGKGCCKGTKELKRTEHSAWHDTFAHAQEYLMSRERMDIAELEAKLARARDRLAHIQAMKETE